MGRSWLVALIGIGIILYVVWILYKSSHIENFISISSDPVEKAMDTNTLVDWRQVEFEWKSFSPAQRELIKDKYASRKAAYDIAYDIASSKINFNKSVIQVPSYPLINGSDITYQIEDVNPALVLNTGPSSIYNVFTLYAHVNALYDAQQLSLEKLIKGYQDTITALDKEVTDYEKWPIVEIVGMKTTRNICDDSETIGGKKGRCADIRNNLIPATQRLMDGATNMIPLISNARSNWNDMLSMGLLNFLNDFSDSLPVPAGVDPSIVASLPTVKPSFMDIISGKSLIRDMKVVGTLSDTNRREIAASASLMKRFWLAIPEKLENYIYVSPTTFKAYLRKEDARSPMCQPIFKKVGTDYVLDPLIVENNQQVCTTEVTPDLLALIPVPAQNFLTQYIVSRTKRIRQYAMQNDPDYKAAVNAFYAYNKDITLTVKSDSQKKADFEACIKRNTIITNPDFIKGCISESESTGYRPDRALPSYTADKMVQDYLGGGNAAAKAYLTAMFNAKTDAIYDTPGSPYVVAGQTQMKPTPYFNIYVPNRNSLFDQLAQGFYDLGDGTKAMGYIYDVFPIGSSILDVRFDLNTHLDAGGYYQIQIDQLKADYAAKIASNLSQTEYDSVTDTFQTTYQTMKEKLASSMQTYPGATARIFYTMTNGILNVTGIAQDQNAAGSFYTHYNGGTDTPLEDSPGKVNYLPITTYYKNPSPSMNCSDPVMLAKIGIDYVAALTAGDLSGATAMIDDAWDSSGSLSVTKVLGVQQLNSNQCAIQWEETAFDDATNQPDPPTLRNVKVSYTANTAEWFAKELLFDAGGFQYYKSPSGAQCTFTADKNGYDISASSPCPAANPNAIFDPQTYALSNPTIYTSVNKNIPLLIDRYRKNLDGIISPAWNITQLAKPIIIEKPYPASVNLDNAAGTCPTVSCMDPKIMYDLIDQYNITEDYEGIILRVIKCTTLNEGQCDMLVDMDYTHPKGDTDAPPEKEGKVLREQVALTVSLDIASCTYTLVDAGPGYGVQENTPLRKDASGVVTPFGYMYNFATKTFTNIATSANTVLSQIKTAYTTAQSALTTYRALTFANIGDLETFQGCPEVRCRNLEVMTAMMKFYDKENLGSKRMGKIIRLGTSVDTPNTCDVTFEFESIKWDNAAGVAIKTPAGTAAARFQFGSNNTSSYGDIFAKRIAAATNPASKASLQAELDEMNGQVSCVFKVQTSSVILPSAPEWSNAQDINNNKAISVVNPSKTGLVNFSNPFPVQGINCRNTKTVNLIGDNARKNKFSESLIKGYTINTTGNTLEASTFNITNIGVKPVNIRRAVNTGLLTCSVEMDISGQYNKGTIYRQYNFTTDDGLQYKVASENTIPTTGMSFQLAPFSDISNSGIYMGLTMTGKTTNTQTNAYNSISAEFKSASPLIDKNITSDIPLSVSPSCPGFDAAGVMAYNGYDKPLDSFKRDPSTFEVRITDNEYRTFGQTYQIVKIYTDASCNPLVDSIVESDPKGSHFSVPLGVSNDQRYYTALLDYFSRRAVYKSDAEPRRVLGQVWRTGADFDTGLIHIEVSMGEYDADDNLLSFYGWPQDPAGSFTIPRAVLACDFRKRFKTNDIYLANLYILSKSSTVLDSTKNFANQTVTKLRDPFLMSSFKFLELTPLSVRSGQTAQLKRVEFYSGNTLLSITSGKYKGSATLVNGDKKSVTGFADLFLADSAKLVPDASGFYEFPVGMPITVESSTGINVDGLSFMTGPDVKCDVLTWKLRGAVNGKFWKNIISVTTPPPLPPYGFWRIPITPSGVILPQNPNRLKGYAECSSTGTTIATLEVAKTISALTYANLSQIIFPGFDANQKNINRAYLTGLSLMKLDDYNNTIYLQGAIQTLDGNYNLADSTAYFILTYPRTKDCRFVYSITGSLVKPVGLVAPTPITFNITTDAPFAWGGYPSALVKYTDTNGQTFEGAAGAPDNTTTIRTFLSYGPDKPASVTLVNPLTTFTTLGLEGAAQMCADNVACIGFSWKAGTGVFFSDPTDTTRLVVNMDKKTYFKNGYTVVTYARFKGFGSTTLSKIGFYKGNTLLKAKIGAIYAIDAAGAQSGLPSVGYEPANLFDYMTTAGWISPANGLYIQFTNPIVITGYTLVTAAAGIGPSSWTLEVSMDGVNWTLIDTRIAVPPAPLMAYPLFRLGGQDSGVSTDFVPKTFSSCNQSCSSPSNLDLMIGLYKQKIAPMANAFQVRSVGRDPGTDQCILSWADDTTEKTGTTGFKFRPVYGDCNTLLTPTNIIMSQNVPITGAVMGPITGSSAYTYFRFKPTKLNGGTGTCLAGIFFLAAGKRLVPASCKNPAGNDVPANSSILASDTNLLDEWQCKTLGSLILSFSSPILPDSFTLFTGTDTARAPIRWILEGSVDGTMWTPLHDQSTTDVVVPATRQMYQIYSLKPNVAPVSARSILEANLTDFKQACDDANILGLVNDMAAGQNIFFNPAKYSYNAATNQCTYQQVDTSLIEASFKTTVGGTTDILSVKRVAGTLATTTPVTSGRLLGIEDCNTSCNDDTMLTALDTFYRETGINTTKAPLVATKYGKNAPKNECVLELDTMFAPLKGDGQPALVANQIGFQFKKEAACSTKPLIIGVDTSGTDTLITPSITGPYKFVRFRVTSTRGAGPVEISAFNFFKAGAPLGFTGIVKNPLGTGGGVNDIVDMTQGWSDANKKPLEFQFTTPLDFDGYSWTTSNRSIIGSTSARDVVGWTLQGSVNGILWKDIESRTTDIKLTDSIKAFKMPIYGLDGSVTVRDVVPLPAAPVANLQSSGQTCATVWPAAKAAYMTFMANTTAQPSTPTMYGYDAANNQCNYKFAYRGVTVTAGFKFNSSGAVTSTMANKTNPTAIPAGVSTPNTYPPL
jgi:hypothetical protein